MKRFNLTHLLLITFTVVILSGLGSIGYAKQNGAPSGNTGSPGDDQSCAHTSCHTGSASAREGLISTDVPATGYLAGNTYLVTVTIDELGIEEFGFQASPQNTAGDLMGEIALINATDTKLVGAGKYITHTSVGTNGTDTRTWTFNWTPVESTGPVTFYVAVNASNNGDNASGDKIYTSSVAVVEDPANNPVAIESINLIQFDITTLAQNEIVVTVETPQNEGISIDLIDLNGRLVASNTYGTSNGVFVLSTENCTDGIYFVRVANEQGQAIKQFFKR